MDTLTTTALDRPTSATLSAHSPKFQSRLTDLAGLRALPEPTALGPWHKPIPHAVLVEAITAEAGRRGLAIARSSYALSKTNAALFGVLDLLPSHSPEAPANLSPAQRGVAFGFRNAIDQQFGLRAVAGNRVFVCDNLMLSGDLIALSRKNTTRLDLGDAIALGFDKFAAHVSQLEVQVLRLEATRLGDEHAKRIVYDLFAARILPSRLFDDVHRFYFDLTDDRPDCQPRTLYGLHNACTRAIKDLSPIRGFAASAAVGRAFDLHTAGTDEETNDDSYGVRVIDVE